MTKSETTRMSRRSFLIGSALVAAQSVGIIASTQIDREQKYNRQFAGFMPLDAVEFQQLTDSYTVATVPLKVENGAGRDDRILTFSLSSDGVIYLTASAGNAEVTFVHPLILKLENGRRHLLPLIRSAIPGRRIDNSINLGRFAAGEHVITLSQDSAVSLALPDSMQLSAVSPNQDSLLASFIDHNPAVKLKNLNNVLDDIPLVGYCNIQKRDSNYLVTSHLIFSSENGGMMPKRLMESYQRTVDIEWVMEQIFRLDGSVVASQRRFQKRDHGIEQFAGHEMIGNSPVLTNATPNNNFADDRLHFWRWNAPRFFASEDKNPIYYAPKPIFMPPNEWSQQILADIPELQEWSEFELAMEGCIDLGYNDQFMADLQIIRQNLQVSYPSRGCLSPMPPVL